MEKSKTKPDAPLAKKGFFVTHFLTVKGQARGRRRTQRFFVALVVTRFSCFDPLQQSVERGTQSLSPLRQPIFDFRRNLRIDGAANHPITFHLPKLLDQHFLRDGRYGAFQVRKAHHSAAEKVKENHQFPPALQDFECTLDTLGADIGV
jgi:hypothetical protein